MPEDSSRFSGRQKLPQAADLAPAKTGFWNVFLGVTQGCRFVPLRSPGAKFFRLIRRLLSDAACDELVCEKNTCLTTNQATPVVPVSAAIAARWLARAKPVAKCVVYRRCRLRRRRYLCMNVTR